METSFEVLKAEGWNLKLPSVERCYQQLSEKKSSAVIPQDVINEVLNTDLCQIGEKYIKEKLSNSVNVLVGPCVLQVGKIRNITAPKENEQSNFAPRMLKISLTDGHCTCHGIELEHIEHISLRTAPGTKVKLIGSIPIKAGLLQLQPSSIKILGGTVEKLYTKWQVAKESAGFSREGIVTEGAPPPFIEFGKRVKRTQDIKNTAKNKSTKSMGNEQDEENSEFNEQRKAAIAEIAKTSVGGKKFSAEGKPNVERQRQYGSRDTKSNAYNKGIKEDTRQQPETNRSTGFYRDLSTASGENVHQKTVNEFVAMGFQREDVIVCLRKTNNSFDEAMDLLLEMSNNDDKQNRTAYGQDNNKFFRGGQRGGRRGGGRGRNRGQNRFQHERNDDSDNQAAPSTTIFDFLESKFSSTSMHDKGELENNFDSRKQQDYGQRNDRFHGADAQHKYNAEKWPTQNRNRNHEQGDNTNNYHSKNEQHSGRDADSGQSRGRYNNRGGRKYSGRDNNRTYQNRSDYSKRDTWREQGGRERNTGLKQEHEQEKLMENSANDFARGRDFPTQRYEKFQPQSNERPPRFNKQNKFPHQKQEGFAYKTRPPREHDGEENVSQGNFRRKENPKNKSRMQRENVSQQLNTEATQSNSLPSSIPPFPDFMQNPRPPQTAPTTFGKGPEKNPAPQKNMTNVSPQVHVTLPQWQNGSQCLAKYWEDGFFYRAVVIDVHPEAPTAVVQFTEYGNYEEVELFNIRTLDVGQGASNNIGQHPMQSDNAPRSQGDSYHRKQERNIKPPLALYVPPSQRNVQ